jgi:hypothetical protein
VPVPPVHLRVHPNEPHGNDHPENVFSKPVHWTPPLSLRWVRRSPIAQ